MRSTGVCDSSRRHSESRIHAKKKVSQGEEKAAAGPPQIRRRDYFQPGSFRLLSAGGDPADLSVSMATAAQWCGDFRSGHREDE